MGALWEGLAWVWAWVWAGVWAWAGPGSGLRLLCLSLASPGPGGWPVYASVPGPVLTLLTVALAPTRWSSLGGPQWKVLNEFPWVRANPLDP